MKEYIVKIDHPYTKGMQELIRCKDCKHLDPEDHHCDSGHDIVWQLSRRDDWYCADGERKDDNDN